MAKPRIRTEQVTDGRFVLSYQYDKGAGRQDREQFILSDRPMTVLRDDQPLLLGNSMFSERSAEDVANLSITDKPFSGHTQIDSGDVERVHRWSLTWIQYHGRRQDPFFHDEPGKPKCHISKYQLYRILSQYVAGLVAPETERQHLSIPVGIFFDRGDDEEGIPPCINIYTDASQPYCSLADLMAIEIEFSPEFLSAMLYGILRAIEYLDKTNCTQKTLGPENIGFREDGTVFWISHHGKADLIFHAPEYLKDMGDKNSAYNMGGRRSRIWSLGITLFLAIMREHPFVVDGDSVGDLLEFQDNFTLLMRAFYARGADDFGDATFEKAERLLQNAFAGLSEKRPDCSGLAELIKKMLARSYSERPYAADLLKDPFLLEAGSVSVGNAAGTFTTITQNKVVVRNFLSENNVMTRLRDKKVDAGARRAGPKLS